MDNDAMLNELWMNNVLGLTIDRGPVESLDATYAKAFQAYFSNYLKRYYPDVIEQRERYKAVLNDER